MPELPEVETTVNGLREKVLGKTITNFWCSWPAMIRHVSSTKLGKFVKDSKIISIRRRAKYILLDLSNGKTLVIHMKMTGHLLYGSYKKTKGGSWEPIAQDGPLRDPYNRFIRVVFSLKNNEHLVLCDMRKFGRIAIHDTKNLKNARELSALGPELWELKSKDFVKIIQSQRGKIKQILLNQTVLAGVGNIYSDEGLWSAGIDPRSNSSKVPSAVLTKLHKELVRITKLSLETGGDSMSDYRNINGIGGKYQNFHKVYRKENGLCLKRGCGGRITRLRLGGRSSHYCPRHQRLYA